MLNRPAHPAFTLIELIMVMVILAIAAALIVPTLRGFAISRATDAAAVQVLTLAQYARTQAVSRGSTYRLNFDVQQRQIWVTMLDADTNTYGAPTNDFGVRYTLPEGMKMTANVIPQPNTLLLIPTTVTQETVQPIAPFGQLVTPQSSTVIENTHLADGVYMEFQPGGRTDPAYVQLTDKLGNQINLGCASATESMHLLTEQEMR